jgi:hypothetical protein
VDNAGRTTRRSRLFFLTSIPYHYSHVAGRNPAPHPLPLPLHLRVPRLERTNHRRKPAHDDAMRPCHRPGVAGEAIEECEIQVPLLSERESSEGCKEGCAVARDTRALGIFCYGVVVGSLFVHGRRLERSPFANTEAAGARGQCITESGTEFAFRMIRFRRGRHLHVHI